MHRFAALALALFGLMGLPARSEAPGPFRDPVAQPFASTSIWNTPLGRGAVFQPGDAPETALLRDQNAGGPAGAFAWIGGHAFGIYRQAPDDPVRTWIYRGRPPTVPWPHGGSPGGGRFSLRTPPGIAFLGGGDGHAILIDQEGRYAYEVWRGAFDAARNLYTAHYIIRTDLRGSGIASVAWGSEGVRAFGGSLAGGLVRRAELERGEIRHAIAMAASTTQASRTRTVWPASSTDGGGNNEHTGLIPMGSLFAIPPQVDLARLGLKTPEGRALARAFQDFGGYITDTAGRTVVVAYLEEGCTDAQIDALQSDKDLILSMLAMVTNNAAAHPGGPGPRVAAPPPPLQGEASPGE
ncbi:hypothetical protein [Methylobacterium nonmethylotrophicum]|uniref:Uncharacterized protein n=1 Tax=Methylobacterium nonmethylotrophicum TaxID=1141884 RepID=A0A4Z0NTL9_9HYPH|nr:hypothetical protein [Methylobacterium nonmethylotrophicum]TGE00527.1 hypothetical protein EU555_07165 [Methylobacterium nonmethylotrophicum]